MTLSRRHGLQLLGAAGLFATGMRPAWAADTSLEDIKKKGVVAIGCEATYPPFSFRKGSEILGYDVDLATMIFAPSSSAYSKRPSFSTESVRRTTSSALSCTCCI